MAIHACPKCGRECCSQIELFSHSRHYTIMTTIEGAISMVDTDQRKPHTHYETGGVDMQHAVIEYNDQENVYVLKDLNTAQGTYVNDCRIQNAAIRLAPGDQIKFGYMGMLYEFAVDTQQNVSCPPVHTQQMWTQPLTLLQEVTNEQSMVGQPQHMGYPGTQGQVFNQNSTLPFLQTGTATLTIPSTVWTPSDRNTLPRPPVSMRGRPMSAGSARRVQTLGGTPVPSPAQQMPQNVRNGWVNGMAGRHQVNQNADISRVQEKEQKIMQLNEEVGRLRDIEMESFRKDAYIQTLQQVVNDLKSKFGEQQPLIMGQDVNLTQRICQLENEVTAKDQELNAVKEQLSGFKVQQQSPSMMVLETDNKENSQLKIELERAKKEKNITSGLVTQMQKDMANKDTTVSRLTREIEALRKEVRERDIQISSVSNKLSKSKDTPLKSTEDRDAREKELISLRQKFKTAENKMQEQQELINTLKQELEKSKVSIFDEKSQQKKLETQIDQLKSELSDVQRTERVVRIDLEQATKRLERFRNRVVQSAYASGSTKTPEGEITDDQLVETLKKLVEERTEFHNKVKEMEKQLKLTDSSSNVFKRNITKLRTDLEKSIENLKSNGFLVSSLKHEMDLLQSVTGDESVLWMRDCLLQLLTHVSTWEKEIETSLQTCGININLSNDGPGKHVVSLHSKLQVVQKEKENLEAKLANTEKQFMSELEMKIQVMKEENENRVKDAIEKTKAEGEEKLNKAIEELKFVEAEKRENAVVGEQKKMEELHVTIEQLRENLQEKQREYEERLQEASTTIQQIDEYKAVQTELEAMIQALETEKLELNAQLSLEAQDRDKKYEQDIEAFKEQNKQHSVTICAMEERLIKLMKKNKDYQEEISVLKKTLQDMKTEMIQLKDKAAAAAHTKPAPPPKPKVIVQKPSEDYVAMEQLVVVLRKENSDLKNTLQSRDDIILGLRRDLAGAHARLSDITGELSENQKQEMEKHREKLILKEKEIEGLRQQMVKLSKIIDKQKDEIKVLQKQLSEEKSISIKFQSNMDEKNRRIKELELEVEQEKLEQKKQLELLDQEGKITSELTALGAQCRGERHEQVITRQREALAELRLRCKSLEQSKPPLPTQDQALQQVIMLKKELAEIKVNQAMSENSELSSGLEREVSRARGMLGSVNAEADMERSAHRETMDALDASESSYMTLLRAMASCLEMESVDGLRPIGHIPKDERERLLLERENMCQVLANRIKVLRERIARKEELLQGYERDLAKLRQAQELASRNSVQVDNLANDVKSRTEETQYLRESLSRTRDRLDQEKRLNKAIKQRKTFHLENERSHQEHVPASHHCKEEDIFGKSSARRKVNKESLRRKNYEINTLKKELCNKEQTLYDTENRLYTLESSIGMEKRREQEIIES
ncbi:forkhead-associated domain-containing protein 1-like isoform X2 [Ostrea edulis]|uniref:forkhead-associated domain-containing protein 1-like isoform X2 n=1 Tax=Ostrea edulis TaxID=37623 RepID=UPI0024AFF4AE|nr:forkhead-associated domain-containing protein 1-like isoform X2 [Ostrea edulis]